MTRLLICRHGQTGWNASGRIQGQTNIELSEIGHAQAEKAADLLAARHPDVLVASDLQRATQTAAAIATATGLTVATDRRLRERGYGPWEGLTDDELALRYPTEFACWRAGEPIRIDGVEELAEVSERMSTALLDAAARAPGGTVVVVTHGGAARRGVGALLGWPDHIVSTLGSLANCHWTELRRGRAGWRLIAHNLGA
ncbi:histidine phosphatase family protein [Actinocatenispora sera]|uniref:Fructose 1,6-bisphosphatase n=1 Tax=Actinocatenispora sera TaxID=390989 RepID=A0A810LAT3_9ACTN|nr:histidine phosphatase family protein [Actinocatenispora sera]BCJ31985.1 fructose 1,6-bisphosphatase [Actinocatenispora sera]